MTIHQVKYEGPSSLAVRVATLLANADGIDLRSAEKHEDTEGSAETARLTLTVEGTAQAVTAAVGSIEPELPPGARMTVQPAQA